MPARIPDAAAGPLTYQDMLKERQKLAPTRPMLSHINLQMDCFLASVPADELRAVCRQMLATSEKSVQNAFTNVAQLRMLRMMKKSLPTRDELFTTDPETNEVLPTPALYDTFNRIRAIFGIGHGFESLPLLLSLVRATSGFRWELDSKMEDALIVLDADLAQALQSSKEQLSKKVAQKEEFDLNAYRQQLKEVKDTLDTFRLETDAWGAEFPYEKGSLFINTFRI